MIKQLFRVFRVLRELLATVDKEEKSLTEKLLLLIVSYTLGLRTSYLIRLNSELFEFRISYPD